MDGWITLRNLRLCAPLGRDAWGRPGKDQPLLVSLRLKHRDLKPAAESDDCSETTSYSDVAKAVIKSHQNAPNDFDATGTGGELDAAHECLLLQMEQWNGTELDVKTICPKAHLRAQGGCGLRSVRRGEAMEQDDLVYGLRVAGIIGVKTNKHEREEEQMIVVDLELRRGTFPRGMETWTLHHAQRQELIKQVIKAAETTGYETVEALAHKLASIIDSHRLWVKATIRIEKPNAIAIVDGCGVEMSYSFTAV